MLTIDEIKNQVAAVSEKHGIKRVYLFGSYARGEANEDSDVDLLIDTSDDVRDLFELNGICHDYEKAIGVNVDMATTGARKKFLDRIKNDRILIYAR